MVLLVIEGSLNIVQERLRKHPVAEPAIIAALVGKIVHDHTSIEARLDLGDIDLLGHRFGRSDTGNPATHPQRVETHIPPQPPPQLKSKAGNLALLPQLT